MRHAVVLLLALAALGPAAGCRRGPSQTDLALQDARDDEQREKLDAEREALRREAAEAAAALGAFAAPLERLREREKTRAAGRWHVVYNPGAGRLQLFHATRPLAACAVARGEQPAPPPGRYPLLRMEILIPPEAGDPPNLPGRPKTAGGLSRLVFAGPDGKPLFFLASKGSPNKPAPPALPRWNIPTGNLDGLSLALKPGDSLFITEVGEE